MLFTLKALIQHDIDHTYETWQGAFGTDLRIFVEMTGPQFNHICNTDIANPKLIWMMQFQRDGVNRIHC